MMRRTIIVFLAALSFAPFKRSFSADAPPKIVNVAVPAVSLLQSPLFVAIDAGAFKKHGMEVRYIVTGARTIQALVGGSVEFAQGVSSRTVPAAGLAGADAVLIANFSDKLLFTMHSAPEIHSLRDLKGKVVGVSGIGGSTDFATRLALREGKVNEAREKLNKVEASLGSVSTDDGKAQLEEKHKELEKELDTNTSTTPPPATTPPVTQPTQPTQPSTSSAPPSSEPPVTTQPTPSTSSETPPPPTSNAEPPPPPPVEPGTGETPGSSGATGQSAGQTGTN